MGPRRGAALVGVPLDSAATYTFAATFIVVVGLAVVLGVFWRTPSVQEKTSQGPSEMRRSAIPVLAFALVSEVGGLALLAYGSVAAGAWALGFATTIFTLEAIVVLSSVLMSR